MYLRPFEELFPELGFDECKFLILPDGAERIAPGRYALVEYYCADVRCDCRRVMLAVTDYDTGKRHAWISYGFDRTVPLCGPFLDPMHRVSEWAEDFLELAKQTVLSDQAYISRLERHYQLYKAAVRNKTCAGYAGRTPVDVEERIASRNAAKKRLQKLQRRKKRGTRP